MKCDYGCEREARYQLKNKKWCCCKSTKSCPEIIKKSSISRIGSKRSKEQKINISLSHIGQRSSKKGKTYDQIYGERSNEIKIKMRRSKLLTRDIKKIEVKFPFLYQVEDFKLFKNIVKVRCKNSSCNKWFEPSYTQIYERHRALTKPSGFEENNFYCSNECKESCILYGSSGSLTTYADNKVFINYVLERDDYKCQYCEGKAEHVHHERPKKKEPFFALDPDLAWSVCKKCHYKYGHKTGTECSTGNLSKVICL